MARHMGPRPGTFPGITGFSSLYLILILAVLCGIVSLAVDLGRVQVAKTELQQAADAAALAGASGIKTGVTESQDRAIAFAGYNKANGSAVVLSRTADIEFGTWDEGAATFTILTGTARANANATRVTARRTAANGNAVELVFAKVLGRSVCDVKATATAMYKPGIINPGIIGIDSVELRGSALIDSWDSSKGAYSSALADDNAVVASNGDIKLVGSVNIRGDAHPGMGGHSVIGATVSGSTAPLNEALSFPPVDGSMYKLSNNNASVSAYMSGGSFSTKGGDNVTFPAGNYYFTNFNVGANSKITISGPITVYVEGSVDLSGTVDVTANVPSNFALRVIGAGPVALGGSSTFCVDLYAPLSPVELHGTSDIYGGIVGKTLLLKGNPAIHYDESLAQPGGPPQVMLVD